MPTSRRKKSLNKPWARSDRAIPRTLVQPLQQFLHTEAAGGVVLLVAAVVALVWANSPKSSSYFQLWDASLSIQFGGFAITESLQHWVNDLAMALFFFVVGLEIKREFVHGDLRSPRVAALPVVCALGGMVVPAAIYFALNSGGDGASGWGIPMATDIAFSVGVLALVGRRLPPSFRVFLLTVAIVDDIGAILVIAIFYTGRLALIWLVVGAVACLVIVGLQRLHVRSLVPYIALAALLWLAMYESGVHATIAGVILGLLTPSLPFHDRRDVQHAAIVELSADHLVDAEVSEERDEVTFLEVSRITAEAVSPLARLERRLHPWSAFVVLPLFALANAGVKISGESISAAAQSRITLGVMLGLLVAKPVGILFAAFLVVRIARGQLPLGAGWLEMTGVGILAGIGFTVSIFITGLAFTGSEAEEAKIAILVASVVAGLLGAGVLSLRRTSDSAAPAVE